MAIGTLLSRCIACACVLGAFTGLFGQQAGLAELRPDERVAMAPSQASGRIGAGPKPEWWGGACVTDPGNWGGWDGGPDEVFMHVLDKPTDEYPNLRIGFCQYWTPLDGIYWREAYVIIAKDPPDFLVDGKWMRWKIRVDTGWEWRYLGYWRAFDGWDAVVAERELPGVVEFCADDPDGKIWVVVQFDRHPFYLCYWSEYRYCPMTYTYGALCGERGRVTGLTRFPTPYQWPPVYLLWTSTGHRVW